MQPAVSLHQVSRVATRRHLAGGARFLLPAILAILLGWLGYQAPYRAHIDVGQLGDQLFLPSSEAQRAEQIARGDWYADQLGPDGRYRWSRERATIVLPGLGRSETAVTLWASGWPADVARESPHQPELTALIDDRVVGAFTPTPERASYTINVPSELVSRERLTLTLVANATFTDTQTVSDPRPKGIRLHAIDVSSGGPGTQPAWLVVLGLGAAALGSTGVAIRGARRSWLPPLVGAGVALLGATLLVVARLWLAAMLPAILLALLLLLMVIYRRILLSHARSLRWRLESSRALDWALLSGLLAACVYLLARLMALAGPLPDFAIDSWSDGVFYLLVWISLAGAALLAAIAGVTIMPRAVLDLRRALLTGRAAAIALGIVAGIWLGYELWLIATLPFVGHADYADNAVVARNLLRGRGWVVDYVTQFYTLRPDGSVTRPQETWPLLQPLLMLPAMALLGPTPFAARLPNIIFLIALTLLIFHIGSRVWDRRVGLIAAMLTLTNLLFFRLAIYATSDLALVVWSMAAFWLVYNGVEHIEQRAKNSTVAGRSLFSVPVSWCFAGIFTGLMILQKPSAGIFAVGMGLWVLWRIWRDRRDPWRATVRRVWLPLSVWIGVAFLVVLPYFVRNMIVFGRPFFSTEAYDAWILYYRGVGKEAWEDIYKVYAPELGGAGLPDRSWILRWGWDLTLGKIAQQARDAWDFFMPPMGKLLSWDHAGIAATWLMLLGAVTLRPRQRSLLGLIAAAVIPYTIFLILYWHVHDEPRYFVPFVPWLALLAAWGACWLFDRIAVIDRGRWAALAGLVITLGLVGTVQRHWREIDAFLRPDHRNYWGVDWEADLRAYAWLRENTPPDAVVMTRVPWQLNFHADRPALMIPNADYDTIMRIAEHYNARYLLTNGTSTSLPESRGDLRPLARGEGLPGWCLLHEEPDDYGGAAIRIYRFPQADGDDSCPPAEARP